jgi:PAS domain S-box-containing protein
MHSRLWTTGFPGDGRAIRLYRTEAALAATQERLRRSQELGGAFPYELHFATQTLVAAPGLGTLFGLKPNELATYEAVVSRIHPEDRPRAKVAHQQAMRLGGAYEQEYRVVLPDGTMRWVLARGEGIQDENGQPKGLAGIVLDITRLKETEAALRRREAELAESERRFRATADAMPQIVWSARLDGYHDYYNRRWYEFTGMPEGSTDGEGWNGLFHPDDQDRAWAKWRYSLATGEPYEIEYRLRHRSGEYRWVLGRALPVRNDQGTIERWFGTCTDIHDLKRAEQALAESEEFTQRLLASSDDCIKVLDLDANLLFINEGGQRMMEVSDFGDVEGCHWPDFWTGPTAEQARAAVEVAKAGGTGRFRGFCPTVAGTPKWWDVVVTSIKGPDGKPERLLSISRDISEAKRAEEELRESQERLHLALSAGMIGTWVWDIPSGRIIADERLARMFSVDPEEAARGAPVEVFVRAVHPEDRPRSEALMAQVAERGGEAELEHRIIRDGQVRWIVARGRAEVDSSGRPVRFPASTIDITDLKQAVEARELLARELSHRIKNIFAVVNGLVALSARGNEAAQPFASALRARLNALAQAHEYVRPHSPDSPAETSAQSVLGLIRVLLAAYLQEDCERIVLEGEDVPIGEKSATALALVLHEQATNAMKYGALSSESGCITIRGERTGNAYALTWTERGGPPVEGPPTRQGFGTVMATRSITGQLGGTLAHDWAREGITVQLSVPVANLLL